MKNLYQQAYESLSGRDMPKISVAMGFDGCIDTIAKPIEHVSKDEKKYFSNISAFGNFIIKKASLSCCIELDTFTKKSGGNMPNYAAALSAFGVTCDCIGALGYPKIHDLFEALGENVKITSVAEAGQCTALEFDDGKIMLADNKEVGNLDYKLLLERVGRDNLIRWVEDNDALAFFNWSELDGMTSVWRGFLDEILPHISNKNKYMIVDISDCSKRSAEEIREMGDMLRNFGKYFRVVFSLNLNENMLVSSAYGENSTNAKVSGETVFKLLNPHALVVHLVDGVLLFEGSALTFLPTYKINSPKISTGGGDNFNAGLSMALLNGMDCKEAIAVANAASSFYVANGRSASIAELIAYLKDIKGKI